MALTKVERRKRIQLRIRKKITGTADRPRVSVFRSNSQIYVQIIDDTAGKTLVAASSAELAKSKEPKLAISANVGKAIATKALAAGISNVVFDRGGYLFHGRVKALADGAREGGLKF
jgi:large subunit ribosomal protein L18